MTHKRPPSNPPPAPANPARSGHPTPRASQPGIERSNPGLRHAHATVRTVRARGTRDAIAPGEKLCALMFAPEPTRAAWIESELARAPTSITIQVGRRVRTVVSALVRDPPPRPHVLIVDFDAVSPAELLELHAIRHEGWSGRLIGLGAVPIALISSLEIDHVLSAPLVRDSLLDCVAGTGHAAATVPIPAHMLEELAPSARSKR